MQAALGFAHLPGCSRAIPVDDILEALCSPDRAAIEQAVELSLSYPGCDVSQAVRRRSIEIFKARRGHKNGDSRHGLVH